MLFDLHEDGHRFPEHTISAYSFYLACLLSSLMIKERMNSDRVMLPRIASSRSLWAGVMGTLTNTSPDFVAYVLLFTFAI
jgi:hypothetical protein